MKRDKTCKKGHESTIGKIIYGFLLFMPLLAIFVTCGYAIFNKNAYQSYASETINERQEVHGFNDLSERYYLRIGDININSGSIIYNVSNVQRETTSVDFNQSFSNIVELYFYYNQPTDTHYMRVQYNDSTYQYINNLQSYYENVVLSFELNVVPINSDFSNYIYYFIYTDLSYLSEVFYYSVEKITMNPLFNWAENSIIYTGMSNFTTSMFISTSFIPLLLTYWLIISLVYFLYDIILVIFIVMHRKIHELEESI